MAPSDGASSISVAVRVRPFTIREAAQLTKTDDGPLFLGEGSLAGVPTPKLSQKNVRPIIRVVDERCLVFDPPEDNPVQRFSRSLVPTGKRAKDQTFAFDRVFDENTTQGDVYEATTKGLLGSVMDGYNATVFAYGATGCGKTHTITGTVQQPGIIFLTMQELFERIAEVQDEKVTEISLSYLEIYNETIRDLLVPSGNKQGLMLREDASQSVSVAGLSSHHPQNVQEVMEMIVRGNECRTMSPTEANATSSRSHAVLQVNIAQKDRNASVNEPHTMATLSVIDLAGSERASATKNRGERLTEGANINKSLLALGSCINALCDPRHRNHVPYRNSKLTRLLKFSLGGNCKTVMIVCISPSSIHYDETQNTLRYANRAKNIQTKVTRNVFNVDRHVKDFLKKIDEQMAMINELKAQQKEYEVHAFAKFRKQSEKREAVVKEALARLRAAHDNSYGERQERCSQMKKLREIERRIHTINSWLGAFEAVCEARGEDEDALPALRATRQSARGILVELESSRHHYHQKVLKTSWHRPIDTALSVGLEQVRALEDGSGAGEEMALEREAELLKSQADREFFVQMMDSDREHESGAMAALLQAHFESMAMMQQLLSMDAEQAMTAARGILDKMMGCCSDASSQLIRPDGSFPATKAFPPSKSGTPKRVKMAGLMGPSPKKLQLAPPTELVRAIASPARPSPRRRLLGGTARRGVAFTPRRKSPTKRAVRWRDDTEDGKLVEYQATPKQFEASPLTVDGTASPRAEVSQPVETSEATEADTEDDSVVTWPVPSASQAQAQTQAQAQPRAQAPQLPKTVPLPPPSSQRFRAGFLARKFADSPAAPVLSGGLLSSSPDVSPLSNLSASRLNQQASPRRSTGIVDAKEAGSGADDGSGSGSGSDTDRMWESRELDTESIRAALKKSSLSRRSSLSQRAIPRRSPPASSPPSAPASGQENLFNAAHVRRPEGRHSVLSPRSTPITKSGLGHRRTTTLGDEKIVQRGAAQVLGHARNSSAGIVLGAGGRVSTSGGGNGSTSSGSSSVAASTPKSSWR